MKHYFLWCALLLFGFRASAQDPLKYSISFPNAVHHEAEISLTVSSAPAGPVVFRMSRSSPGRYATHEFGKNIYHIKATDDNGKELAVNQIEGDVYSVSGHTGTIKVTYTIFGNWVDGTYMAVDETHAHLNIPATFLWVPALSDRPIQLQINDLSKYGWRVATQLKELSKDTYEAPNLQYFMDSPIEIAPVKTVSWKDVNPGNRTQTITLATHSTDDQTVVNNFAAMVEKITREQKAIFGELPDFDFGTYTFLQDVGSDNAGDGMEHRNSTVITSGSAKIAGNESGLLSTFSHEFFHAWNVERIRPKSLEPFNFQHANMSSDLWFAEGFTQYYGNLVLRRAGLRTDQQFEATMAGIINGVLNSPGAQNTSATAMSRRAVFVDAGVSVDQNNYSNTFVSYYTYGAFIALALDLRLRSDFNLSLDDYMQAVWKAHGKPEIPYTAADLESVLGKLSNSRFASDFFSKYVHGTEKNDYQKLLANAGLSLRKANAGAASIGPVRLTFVEYTGKNRVAGLTQKGSAAYNAGIDQGDYILQIGDDKLQGSVNLNQILTKYKPGQTVKVVFEHRGVEKTADLTFQENNTYEIVAAQSPSAGQIKFRTNWLSSKIK